MCNVAWIGLGQMGRPMAARLVGADHDVRGVEIDETAAAAASEVGVQLVESVSEAVRGADVVFTMLPSGKHVENLLTGPDGVFSLIGAKTLVVDCSTVDITMAGSLHERAQEAGVAFLDAPVSGGVSGAAGGSLTIMVGGAAENMAKAEPLLQTMGSYVVHVGPGGAGQSMKIVNNMMFGIGLAAACEGAVLSQRLGIDAQVFYDVVTRSSGDNWVFRTWFPLPGVLPTAPSSRDYTPGFTTNLLVKDLTLAAMAGDSTDAPLATARTALGLLKDNAEAGAGQRDCTSLVLELSTRGNDATASEEVVS